jgi:hypothetical protein
VERRVKMKERSKDEGNEGQRFKEDEGKEKTKESKRKEKRYI